MIIDENQLSSAHKKIEYNQTQNKQQKQKNNSYTAIDQNSYYYKLAPISA